MGDEVVTEATPLIGDGFDDASSELPSDPKLRDFVIVERSIIRTLMHIANLVATFVTMFHVLFGNKG